MANTKISALTSASALSGTEVVPGVQSGGNVKITTQAIADLINLGPSWTNLTFGASNTYFGTTSHKSNQSFTLAAGEILEVEAYIYKVIDNDSQLFIGNDSLDLAYCIRMQADNNNAIYRRNAGAFTVLQTSGANATYDFTGTQKVEMKLGVHAASNNFLWTLFNDQRMPASTNVNNTTFSMVGAQNIYIQTGDITKCFARARIIQ